MHGVGRKIVPMTTVEYLYMVGIYIYGKLDSKLEV